jgi:hypothetical protein
MAQSGIAIHSGTAAGALPPVFSSNGQIADILPSGIAVTLGDAEAPAAVLSSETLRWSELTYGGQTFVLNKELTIRVTQEEGGWSFAEDEFRLLGFGHTRDEAELAFRSDFSYCWNEIAREDDSRLARRAKEMKRAFLGLVDSVGRHGHT